MRAPFWLAAGLALVNAVAMLAFLPETLAPENRRPFVLREATVFGAFRPLFAATRATPLLIAWFLWQLGSVVYPATWSFWATLRFGWSAAAIGWSLAWVGFLQLLVQVLFTGRAVTRLGEWGAAVLGLGCGAVTLLAYAFVTQGWQVYAFFLIGCLGALAWPALNGILSRSVDATRQGALQGGIGSMNSVAAIIGPLVAAQSLAWGSARGFDGAAFLVAGGADRRGHRHHRVAGAEDRPGLIQRDHFFLGLPIEVGAALLLGGGLELAAGGIDVAPRAGCGPAPRCPPRR